MKLTHILFPTDFSPQNKKVREYVTFLGKLLSCNIHILHAIEPINGEQDEETEKFYQELLYHSHNKMQAEVAFFKGMGLNVESHVEVAPRWQSINQYVEKKHIDLIIMGSSRIVTDKGAFSIGNTSHKIFITALCPVLFVF
jgi:nucleotide-binding universal stress UspA family protein